MGNYTRRSFLEASALVGASSTLFPGVLYAQTKGASDITVEQIEAAELLAGISFTPEERKLMLQNLERIRTNFGKLHELKMPNSVIPSMVFDPQIGGVKAHRLNQKEPNLWQPPKVDRPASDEDLAFMTVPELSSLLRYRQVTSLELTHLYLSRLKKYDGVLHAVVTLTEERALRQARAADAELDAGYWRGPLHGIPWGAKDLLAVKGYVTTWGAMPYRDQSFDYDAEVVRRLDDAGAVLIAKLTLGALAQGDVWFGEKTRNPWNPDQGSSGSSAGPGSTVAAGLVGFAIGSETLGSIVSPSTRNGVTGHRPTFGRVSRVGAMTLSWTMDKLGPMCRSAACCALVFQAIHGADSNDPTTLTTPFSWPSTKSVDDLRVGYLKDSFSAEYDNQKADQATLDVLQASGVKLRPVALPDMDTGMIMFMLSVEASAAFEDLTLSGRVNELVSQGAGAWPNSFRSHRFVPAVDYINASRARTLLMQQMASLFESVDVIVTPTFRGNGLGITNLTGHPSITIPNAFRPVTDTPNPARRQPDSITIIGQLYQDEAVLAVADFIQNQTNHHRQRPPIA
ncbi:MAG: amidase [Bacteroidetes bacterium]|nr:amidase [Bacteroidota bacterium]